MKTLVISASGRKEGTINRACALYAKKEDAQDSECERISLFDYSIKPCTGCLACAKDAQCRIKDDFDIVYKKIMEATHIVIGAPVYCHDVPGVLKTFMDRCCSKVVPYIDVDVKLKAGAKLKLVRYYQSQFAKNAPLKGKTFTTITACSTPNKNNKDMKKINHTLKQFIQEEMKGKIVDDIRYADTLFQFKKIII